MKRFFYFMILILVQVSHTSADTLTDKTMSKISRDTRTYISADARGATEQEAYDQAMKSISVQIADYFKTELGLNPEAIYLTELASIYQRLASHIADNRYRVMLYVKKADLKPIGDTTNSLVLTKNTDSDYHVVHTTTPASYVNQEPEERIIDNNVIVSSTLNQLLAQQDKNSLLTTLTNLRKENKILAAASFPIANYSDYYIVAISSTGTHTLIHVTDGKWINVSSGQETSPESYRTCTAYWFTLPQ